MNAPVRVPGTPAAVGDNNPPAEPTPFDLSRDEIDGLYLEAKNWLDGSGVQSQADADGVSRLLDMIRQAVARADERRAEEKRPHDEAAAAVQARYNDLIGKTKAVTGKAVLATEACKKALQPFLQRQEAEKRAKAEAARREAEEKAAAAQKALRASRVDDLEARERAEALSREAKASETAGRRAESDKAHAKGGSRAIGLVSTYRAEVTDPAAFAKWAWVHHRHEVDGMFRGLAERLCSAGQRELPGVTIHEERVAR